jgi:dynactin-4
MAAPFPYAHYACPCSTSNGLASSKRASQLEPQDEDTFNPHDARAAYALYPLDNLLFCDECSQIRCQKCVNDEIITWFCPSCLFDVPSGQVRGENNRCARNCYNCPSCTSPLHVTQVEKQATGLEDAAAGEEAYLLFCQYCDWCIRRFRTLETLGTGAQMDLQRVWEPFCCFPERHQALHHRIQ